MDSVSVYSVNTFDSYTLNTPLYLQTYHHLYLYTIHIGTGDEHVGMCSMLMNWNMMGHSCQKFMV